MQNLISAQISDEDLKEVLQAIALIKQKLPFLQKLSKRAKKSTSMLKNEFRLPAKRSIMRNVYLTLVQIPNYSRRRKRIVLYLKDSYRLTVKCSN